MQLKGILGLGKKVSREDPVFGSVFYMGDRLKYWEGKTLFAPTSSTVEVFVDGFANDDMEQQHGFFNRLVQEWPTLSGPIGDLLLKTWSERLPKARLGSPWENFNLSSITIPKGSLDDSEWEMSFSAGSDRAALLTVRMKGRQPQAVVVDD